MSPEEAKARIRQLGSDRYWTERFKNNDTAAKDEFERLRGIVIAGAVAKATTPHPDAPLAPFARDQAKEYAGNREFRNKFFAGDPEAVKFWNETVKIAGADQ